MDQNRRIYAILKLILIHVFFSNVDEHRLAKLSYACKGVDDTPLKMLYVWYLNTPWLSWILTTRNINQRGSGGKFRDLGGHPTGTRWPIQASKKCWSILHFPMYGNMDHPVFLYTLKNWVLSRYSSRSGCDGVMNDM